MIIAILALRRCQNKVHSSHIDPGNSEIITYIEDNTSWRRLIPAWGKNRYSFDLPGTECDNNGLSGWQTKCGPFFMIPIQECLGVSVEPRS